ncbi:cyanase [Halospina sp. K52047b]|uniref:cyanase n=1 Tax=Halospina sp. K52047b TaxID=2614160 RepID=UPI00124AC73A|nr:cyanase [Halospina sp. K52047b]KAA8977779.1 cyanase [Halospina sp. K52047b]
MMNHETMTAAILNAKNEQGYTWEQLAESIGMSPVWTASCCYGMNTMLEDQAKGLCKALNLGDEVAQTLQTCPHKHWDNAVPTDPLIYRIYEACMIYGDSVKDIIHEKFGDGIMSAIDYKMYVDRVEDPKGDRVVITMDGKFLPFKRW